MLSYYLTLTRNSTACSQSIMASNDILKSKLGEFETLLTYLKQAVNKDVTKDNDEAGDDVVSDDNTTVEADVA